MPAPQINDFGFKRLSVENWLTVDPAWAGVAMSASRPDPSEAWVHDLSQITLTTNAPLAIRKLFETARGTLVYSLMFYPLLALGAEQLFRVLEASAAFKCNEMGATPKRSRTFENKIDWLAEQGVIAAEDKPRWHAARHLRNDTSHPKDQNIYNLAMALTILDATVDLINPLFCGT
jgi:hypothetical protein